MTRYVVMLGDLCPCCMVWHGPPACAHDSTQPCPACGLPFGYLTAEMDPAGPCWFCVAGRPRPSAPARTDGEPEDWVETI